MKRRPKVRELLAELRDAGWRPVRCRGSHQIWRAPDGRTMPLVINHMNDDATPSVVASFARTSVWRACVRLGLPLRRVPAKQEADQRRFAYPHRLMMVLSDGKHFRAGPRRRKRVAVFFLDDASRFGLGVVVGTAESVELFLRGLHAVIRRFGFMDILFLDRGPGFRADDTAAACRRLDIRLVLGTAAYPEGHGKIERFNQTAQAQVLRGLLGADDVDDDCGALELRLAHFLDHGESQQPHEALGGQTPLARFEADTRALRFPADDAELADRFVVTETRKVSNDNVVSYEGIDYEVPRGHLPAAGYSPLHLSEYCAIIMSTGRAPSARLPLMRIEPGPNTESG